MLMTPAGVHVTAMRFQPLGLIGGFAVVALFSVPANMPKDAKFIPIVGVVVPEFASIHTCVPLGNCVVGHTQHITENPLEVEIPIRSAGIVIAAVAPAEKSTA